MSQLDGTWTSDAIHSSLDFTVRHNIVSVFRGQVNDFVATVNAEGDRISLAGTAKVDSIQTKDENLTGHLRSPDFFDLERHPEVTIASTAVRRSGDDVTVDADLTMRGVTKPVTFTGTIAGPVDGAFGGTKLGLELEGKVDRTDFGMNWNAPMPGGGFILSKDVKILIHLELDKA